ncbi:hypothetical protein HZB01_05530 [Candidatus Woesearchaeota archaeon]|nr:hypothetical protein [Candidatus Woesearchaeota archaeon]
MNLKDMLIIAMMGLLVVAVGALLQSGFWSSKQGSPTGFVVGGDASGAAATVSLRMGESLYG